MKDPSADVGRAGAPTSPLMAVTDGLMEAKLMRLRMQAAGVAGSPAGSPLSARALKSALLALVTEESLDSVLAALVSARDEAGAWDDLARTASYARCALTGQPNDWTPVLGLATPMFQMISILHGISGLRQQLLAASEKDQLIIARAVVGCGSAMSESLDTATHLPAIITGFSIAGKAMLAQSASAR
jgi:hypothetical protein